MKIDLIKLIALIWMGVVAYLMYEMLKDLDYMTGLVYSYIKMIMEYPHH
jgi:hypothetical protein